MKFKLVVSTVMIASILMSVEASAVGIDLHRMWDNRCADCHGHSGDFARQFLKVSGDELQGRHHVHDLRRFLHNHYLVGKEVDGIYNMLHAQTNSSPRFKHECANCHETAAEFVRNRLVLLDGVLNSRVSELPVRGFLDNHMNLESDDVEFFMNLLTRVAHEVYRP